MIPAEYEIETKFFLRDLEAVRARLEALGAQLVGPRVLETNLRFDTAENAITRARQVLRLRQDTAAVVTFKGPNQSAGRLTNRQEIEFTVSDFETAKRFLEALGYRVVITYQKYRTTYRLNNLAVTVDELPMGSFLEIEGPDPDGIEATAKLLKLNWHDRSTASYVALFYQFRAARGLTARNLTFAELEGFTAQPKDIGLNYAD